MPRWPESRSVVSFGETVTIRPSLSPSNSCLSASSCRNTQLVTATRGLSISDSSRSGCIQDLSSPERSPQSSNPSGDQFSMVAGRSAGLPTTFKRRPGSRHTSTSPFADAAARASPPSEIASFVSTSASDFIIWAGSAGTSELGERRKTDRPAASRNTTTAAATATLAFPFLPYWYTVIVLRQLGRSILTTGYEFRSN